MGRTEGIGETFDPAKLPDPGCPRPGDPIIGEAVGFPPSPALIPTVPGPPLRGPRSSGLAYANR